MVEVKKDGFTMRSQKVTVEKDGRTTLMVQLEPLETPRPGEDAADNRASRSDNAGPRSAPVDRGVATPPPTSPPVADANSNTNPTVALEHEYGKTDPARPGANEPARARAIDAAIALRGKAEIVCGQWLVEGRELVATDPGKGGQLLFGDLRWTDYDFMVEVMREKGNGATALFFHRTLRNYNHIAFAIGEGTDSCWLGATKDGRGDSLRQAGFHLVDRRWYRARVSVRRNHIVCTLHDDQSNEHVHLEADDDRLPSGQVGLATIWGSSYRFRNIKVTDPDGKILWEMPPAIGESPAGKKLSGTPGGDRTPSVTRGGPEDHKYGNTDPARPRANEPARAQAIDAAIALRGKAEIVTGSWLVEGRELVQTDAGKVGKLLFGDLRWTDYDFTVEVMREKGPGATFSAAGSSALVFHRTLRNDNQIWFRYWTAPAWVRDMCGLGATEDGREDVLHPDVEFHFVDRRWYRARVSVRRNHIVCTIHDDQSNEHVHLEADDDRLPSGQVGLMTWWSSSYRFRNIKVTAPDGKTLWEMPPAIGAPPPAPGRR
jgi:hypothetical protein